MVAFKNIAILLSIGWLLNVAAGALGQEDQAKAPSRLDRAKALLGRAVEAASGAAEKGDYFNAEQLESYRQRLATLANLSQMTDNQSIQAVAKFLGESLGKLTESGVDLNTYAEWAGQTYQTLKEQGLTSAASAYEWWSAEMKKAASWEYRVLTVPATTAALQKELDTLGADGWECVGPSLSGNSQVLIFKRRGTSFLTDMPVDRSLQILKLLKQ